MIVLGIDIGMTGAVAAIDAAGRARVSDLVTKADACGKRLDGRALSHLLHEFIPPGEVGLAIIEDVRVRNIAGRMAHSSEGSLMRSRGIVESICDVCRIDLQIVQPGVWKRWYGLLGKDKGESLAKARTLYPAVDDMLRRVKDHNRAEALLIAHYGQRVLS